jgi:hypothetical protein
LRYGFHSEFLANPVKIGSTAAYIISLLLHSLGVLTIYTYLQPHPPCLA